LSGDHLSQNARHWTSFPNSFGGQVMHTAVTLGMKEKTKNFNRKT
jgi:hypothetical protein